jgi:hypothetical protein
MTPGPSKWSVSQIMSTFPYSFDIDLVGGPEVGVARRPLMRGSRPQPCIFPEGFVQEARQTARQRAARWQDVQRSRLVLLVHENPWIGHKFAGDQVGLSARQVRRWRQRWAAGDFTVDDQEGRGRKASFSPDGSCPRYRDRL